MPCWLGTCSRPLWCWTMEIRIADQDARLNKADPTQRDPVRKETKPTPAPTWVPARLKVAWSLIDETLDEYSRDRGDLLSAALAFYTLLSIAPLIIVAVAIAGAILGTGAARYEMTRVLGQSMGPNAAQTVMTWVDEASRARGVASIIGFALLLFGASKLVAQLRNALNQIWGVDVFFAEGFKNTVQDYIRRRLFAFAAVMAAGPLLLAVFASRALLTGLHGVFFADSPFAGVVVQVTQVVFSVVVVGFIAALVFKVVPDTRIGWRSVWIGGLLTSILFNIGNALVGLYLGQASVTAAYGAAGSVVVVLLWSQFSAQLFLYGAEFTQVYAKRFGRGLAPEEEREVAEAENAARREAEAAAPARS